MAKKKKGKKGRSTTRKRSAPKKDKSVPLGAAGGMFLTGEKILFEKTVDGYISPVEALFYSGWTPAEKVSKSADRLASNAMDLKRYYPLVGGAVISSSKRMPLIGMVARPVDKMLKRLSKGKVGL